MDWSECDLVDGEGQIRGTGIAAESVVRAIPHLHSGWEALQAEFPTLPNQILRPLVMYVLERLAWDTETLVDWKDCLLVEQVPGRLSGAPTIIGTRIQPDTIAKLYWHGDTVDEIRENYPTLLPDTIRALIQYIQSREARAA